MHFPDFMKPSTIAWWGGLIEVTVQPPFTGTYMYLHTYQQTNYSDEHCCPPTGGSIMLPTAGNLKVLLT